MNILVCDQVHIKLIEGLKRKGHHVVIQTEISQESLISCISEYEGLIINTRNPVDKIVLENARLLKCVARLGSGKEILDLEELQRRRIKIITTPEANCNAVAEHALGMLLNLFRNINKSTQEIKSFQWKREENRGIEIKGKSIGIIGFGHTGSRLATLLCSFGCKIKVFDKFTIPIVSDSNITIASDLNQLLDSDIISLHVSYLKENHHLVNKEFIDSMKKPFYLLNTSRGMVIDTRALIAALDSGKILGACLDVLENENPKNYTTEERDMYAALFSRPNLVLTSHIAGWTFESYEAIAESILNQWPDSE